MTPERRRVDFVGRTRNRQWHTDQQDPVSAPAAAQEMIDPVKMERERCHTARVRVSPGQEMVKGASTMCEWSPSLPPLLHRSKERIFNEYHQSFSFTFSRVHPDYPRWTSCFLHLSSQSSCAFALTPAPVLSSFLPLAEPCEPEDLSCRFLTNRTSLSEARLWQTEEKVQQVRHSDCQQEESPSFLTFLWS